MVAAAAAAITVATYFAFPQSYIFFGILHCIALSSVLALPFLRLPWWAVGGAAAIVLAAPHGLASESFDAPALLWVGLGTRVPPTNDYVPIFPWFSFVLVGVVAGRILLARRETMGLAVWRSRDRFSGLLIWAGRKSLPIYLTHQIILLGILYGVLQIVGPNRMAEAQPFMNQCEAACLQNAQPQTCRPLCSCTVESLRQSGLWQKVLNNTTTAEDQTRISRAAQQCLRQSPPS
jgi:uncharacterized membrane protein